MQHLITSSEAVAKFCEQFFLKNPVLYAAAGTVQLHHLIGDEVGKVSSSGVLVGVDGRQYVLTVLHGAIEDIGLLGREVSTGQVGVKPIGKYPVYARQSLNKDGGRGDPIVDFTFFPLPDNFVPIRNLASESESAGAKSVLSNEFEIQELPIIPIEGIDRVNCCCGGALPKPKSPELGTESIFNFVHGLVFNPQKSDDTYWYFDVPKELESGDLDLSGMSGAPIFNESGIPIALLCGDCTKDEQGNSIPRQFWGVSMNHAIGLTNETLHGCLEKFGNLPFDKKIKVATNACDLSSHFYANTSDLLWQFSQNSK